MIEPSPPASITRQDRLLAGWLLLLFAALYLLTMGGRTYSTDDIARYDTVVSIVERGALEIPHTHSASHATNEGRVYSKYGLGKPVLLIPFYLVGRTLEAAALGGGWITAPVVASTLDQWLAALAVALCFLAARLLGYRRATSVILALLLGAATMLWPLSKFAFEHPLVTALLLATFAALLHLRRGGGTPSAIVAGVCLAYVLFTRVSDFALAGLPLGVYFLGGWRCTRHPWRAVAVIALPILAAGAAVMFYNYARFDDIFESGYDDVDYDPRFLYVALAGLLVSPGKSVFLFNPPLVAALVSGRSYWKRFRAEALLTLGLITTYLLGFGTLNFWHGDWCIGPRYLLPVVPFVLLAAGAALEDRTVRRRTTWLLAICAGVGLWVAVVAASVDYALYCGRFVADLDRARFVPQMSPLVVYLEYIGRGEVTYYWREVWRSASAPGWLRAVAPALGLLALAGMAAVARLAIPTPDGGDRRAAAGATDTSSRPWWSRRRLWLGAGVAGVILMVLAVGPGGDRERPADHGWTGFYYAGGEWIGEPLFTRIDERLDFSWSSRNRPVTGPFSIEWHGALRVAESGHYKFFLRSDDGAWLFIDGALVVDNGGAHGVRQLAESVYLETGVHPARLRYFDSGFGEAKLRLAWKPEGDIRKQVLAGRLLLPRPYGEEEEYLLDRALGEHAAGRMTEAAEIYAELAADAGASGGPHSVIAVAARAQLGRTGRGVGPLVPGLVRQAASGESSPILPGLTPLAPMPSTAPPFARLPDTEAADAPAGVIHYAGRLLVPDGRVERLGLTANTSIRFVCDACTLAVEERGFDTRRVNLLPGLHAVTIQLEYRPGVTQAELWWQRAGERPEPVPRALLLGDDEGNGAGGGASGGAAPTASEQALIDLLAAREYERLGRRQAAARHLVRLAAAGDTALAHRDLRRLYLHGARGTYYANGDWSGPPLLVRIDPTIDFDWSRRRLVAGPMSVIWEAELVIDSTASYTFDLESDDGAWLYLDQRPLIDNGGIHARQTTSARIELARGRHSLRLTYFDTGFGEALVRLFWRETDDRVARLIPSDRLLRPDVAHAPLLSPLELPARFDAPPAPASVPPPNRATVPLPDPATVPLPDPATDPAADPPAPRRFDFDSGAYLDWIAAGEAFGPRPALGAIGSQHPIVDPAGGGLANSFWRSSDFYQGELRSRPFRLEGDRLTAWIGGGEGQDNLYLGLEVDARIVRRATGHQSETMHEVEWDVGEWRGRTVQLVIVDAASGHFGHILVDGIAID